MSKPKVSGSAQQELDRAEQQFEQFNENVKALTMDRMNEAPKQEVEPQTLMSQKDLARAKEIHLRPSKTCSSKEKFNEDFRKDYDFMKQEVNFIAEHKELIGETIEMWTKPFAGMPAEYWEIPTNKPVWGPRYLAEQIKRKGYHRLVMKNQITAQDGMGQYYGQMAADTTVQRLDAFPVNSRHSVFMGAVNF